MSNGRFGASWWTRGDTRRVATPVGVPCYHCEEPIALGDDGEMQGLVRIPSSATLEPIHRECLIRRLVGSVAHQQQRCTCHGGTEEDPPGMTKREAARAATDLFEKGQIGRLNNEGP